MPGCIVSATTASFRSVEKRRLRATPVITSTLENVSDIGTCLGLSLGPPASAGVRSKRGALHPKKIPTDQQRLLSKFDCGYGKITKSIYTYKERIVRRFGGYARTQIPLVAYTALTEGNYRF